MLFKRGNRSFRFCLVGLNDEEYAEMSTLIIENGGEIREASSPATITFTNTENYQGEDAVFHVDYIRECVRCGRLLDLIHFKLGKRGLYSCLMSLFICGKSTCPFIDTMDTYRTPADIEQFANRLKAAIDTDHDYARGDTIEQAANTSSEIPSTVPDPVQQGGQRLPEESLPESANFPGESLFFPDSQMSVITETNSTMREEDDRTSENREPVRNDKLSQDQTIRSPDQTLKKITMIKCRQNLPSVINRKITVRSVLTRRRGEEQKTAQTSFISNASESNSEIIATGKNGSCEDSPVIIKEEVDESCPRPESQPSKNSDSSISEPSTLKLKNSEITGVSEDTTSPTILRDEFNRIKILGGGTKQLFRKFTELPLTSDSNETINDSNPIVVNPLQRRLINPVAHSSTSRSGQIDGEKRHLRRKSPSPLKWSDSSENEENEENVPDKEKLYWQSKSKKKSNHNGRNSANRMDTAQSNHNRQTAASSTRSSEDVILISDDDSVLIPKSEEGGNHSPRAGPSSSTTNGTTNQLARPNASKRTQRFSRNFSPWEQRAMVKYLIDKNCIPDAKGYKVWKQMIADGYLGHRTYQSLHNHFRKFILPFIDNYSLANPHLRKFKRLQE